MTFIPCNRGAPFDGPYDVARQCRIDWLYQNDAEYRAEFEKNPPHDHGGTPYVIQPHQVRVATPAMKCPHMWKRVRDAEGKIVRRVCKTGG